MATTMSNWPASRSSLTSWTPKTEPTRPPHSNTVPILKSTFLRRHCAIAPETDEATIWAASVPTATAGGMPEKISKGVIKKPPPTPNMPDRKPTAPPMPRKIKMLADISAIGR